jgi:hypothetical protein
MSAAVAAGASLASPSIRSPESGRLARTPNWLLAERPERQQQFFRLAFDTRAWAVSVSVFISAIAQHPKGEFAGVYEAVVKPAIEELLAAAK